MATKLLLAAGGGPQFSSKWAPSQSCLLQCPRDTVAGFPQRKQSKRELEQLSPYELASKSHDLTFPMFCLFGASH